MNPQSPKFPPPPGGTGRSAGVPLDRPMMGGQPSMGGGMPVVGAPITGSQMGVQQQSPHQTLLNMLKHSNMNSVDYKESTATGLKYDTMNEWLNTDAQDTDLQKVREQEIKNYFANVILQIGDEFSRQIGRHTVIEEAFKFLSIKYLNNVTMPSSNYTVSATAERFWTTAMRSAVNRRSVGINIGTVFSYNVGQIMLQDAQPTPQDVTKILQAAADHIFALEIARWLTASPSAREFSRINGKNEELFKAGILRQINHVQDSISTCFSFFEMPCPYDGFIPEFEERIDAKSNPLNYVLKQNPTPDQIAYGVRPNIAYSESGELNAVGQQYQSSVEYLMRRKANQHQNHSTETQRMEYVKDPNTIHFGPDYNGRTDFENMTKSNIIEFDWERKLIPIPNTPYYTATLNILGALKEAFFPGEHSAFPIQWDRITVFTITDGKPDRDPLLIDIGSNSMSVFLTNPEKLLPYLKEVNGQVVIGSEHDIEYNEDDAYDLDTVIEASLVTTQPVISYLPGHVKSDHERLDRSAKLAHKEIAKGSEAPIATSYASTEYVEIEMSSEVEVNNTINDLRILIKDETPQGTYYDFIEVLYRKLINNHTDKPDLISYIDQHLSSTLERYFIEKHGFSNIPDKPNRFMVGTLTDCWEDLREIIGSTYPVIDEMLMDKKHSANLIQRSKCLLKYHQQLNLLMETLDEDSPTYDQEKALVGRTIILARECVVTRLSNVGIPVNSPGVHIARVKRSERPELFHIIERAYRRIVDKELGMGAEQIVIFDGTPDSRWTFQTSAYDPRNVGTMRRLKDRTDLFNLELHTTYY